MNENWNQNLTNSLRDLPQQPQEITRACGTIGESLGRTAQQAGMPREDVVNQFRQGLDRGYSGGEGGGEGSTSSHR